MSTTTNCTDQACPGFLKRPNIGDKLRNAWIAWNTIRIANVLEGIVGTGGIVIKKPKNADGAGWTIDGSGITGGGGMPPGYEEITGTIFMGERKVFGTFLVKSNTGPEDTTTLVKTDYTAEDTRKLLQAVEMDGEEVSYQLNLDYGFLKAPPA